MTIRQAFKTDADTALNHFTLVRKQGRWLLRDHGTVIAVCATLGMALSAAAESHLTLS